MDSLNPPPPELTLDLNHKQTHQTPKSVYVFLREISTISDFSQKKSKAGEYVHGLEEEMKKIEVFKRELPLSMLLLNDAIEALKEEVRRCRTPEAQPMMKEFIPLPGNLDEDGRAQMEKDSRDKKNWMSSAQLWSSNCSSDSNSNIISDQRQHPVERVEEDRRSTSKNPFTHWKGEGAFEPFKGYSGGGSIVMNKKKEDTEVKSISSLSLLLPNLKAPMDPSLFSKSKSTPIMHKVLPDVRMPSPSPPPPPQLPQPPQQLQRKQRRCWSPELHRRFVSALQQLGGSQAATPKQIRELMKVDGLTNDEVKSHLQKYRLHTRRSSNGSAGSNQSVVVLGGLWMPQDNECEKSHSGSPQGPLQLASTTGGNSMEDDEDDKSETYSWKGHRSSEEDDEA